MERRSLNRDTARQMVAGVCAGLGNFFSLDPTVVRVAWVLFAMFNWVMALLLYFGAAILIPDSPYSVNQGRWQLGLLLVALGSAGLFWNLGGQASWLWLRGLSIWQVGFWPIVLVLLGLLLVFHRSQPRE